MSEATTLTIRLEPGAKPIAGVVVIGGEETAFVGWIELTALIEALHSTVAGR
jgi:hypothetical protein